MSDKHLYWQLLGLTNEWKVTDVAVDFTDLKVGVLKIVLVNVQNA